MEKKIEELLLALYRITAAESPEDMYDIAVETLKKYGIDPASIN